MKEEGDTSGEEGEMAGEEGEMAGEEGEVSGKMQVLYDMYHTISLALAQSVTSTPAKQRSLSYCFWKKKGLGDHTPPNTSRKGWRHLTCIP